MTRRAGQQHESDSVIRLIFAREIHITHPRVTMRAFPASAAARRIALPGRRIARVSTQSAHALPFTLPQSVGLETSQTTGRSLVALAEFAPGDVVLEDSPLVAVGPPQSPAEGSLHCGSCFRALPAQGSVACPGGCGTLYCSKACRAGSASAGHDLLCVPASELDSWCAEFGRNFPRASAALVARSLAPGVDFANFWRDVNALASVPVPADIDAIPREWHTSYALLRTTLRRQMGGPGADAFFTVAFDLRSYARLQGTLRLNSFTLACPLPDGRLEAEAPRASSSARQLPPDAASAAPPPPACPTQQQQQGAGGTGVAGGDDAGCCSSDDPGGGCGSGGTTGPVDLGHGGTALYGAASLVNHACDANLDVVIGPHALLHLRGEGAAAYHFPRTAFYPHPPPRGTPQRAGGSPSGRRSRSRTLTRHCP